MCLKLLFFMEIYETARRILRRLYVALHFFRPGIDPV